MTNGNPSKLHISLYWDSELHKSKWSMELVGHGYVTAIRRASNVLLEHAADVEKREEDLSALAGTVAVRLKEPDPYYPDLE